MKERLVSKWVAEARRHELAADENWFGDKDEEERFLHIEIARVLRNCVRDLEEITS